MHFTWNAYKIKHIKKTLVAPDRHPHRLRQIRRVGRGLGRWLYGQLRLCVGSDSADGLIGEKSCSDGPGEGSRGYEEPAGLCRRLRWHGHSQLQCRWVNKNKTPNISSSCCMSAVMIHKHTVNGELLVLSEMALKINFFNWKAKSSLKKLAQNVF